jgi:hypothetical protein
MFRAWTWRATMKSSRATIREPSSAPRPEVDLVCTALGFFLSLRSPASEAFFKLASSSQSCSQISFGAEDTPPASRNCVGSWSRFDGQGLARIPSSARPLLFLSTRGPQHELFFSAPIAQPFFPLLFSIPFFVDFCGAKELREQGLRNSDSEISEGPFPQNSGS